MRGPNEPHIHFVSALAAQRTEFAVLQGCARELRLHAERHLADFVEKSVPPSATSKRPARAAFAPVKAPRTIAEECRLEQGLGDACAALADEFAAPGARAILVNHGATSSFPVPLSPTRRRGTSLERNPIDEPKRARIGSLRPTMSS